MVMARRPSGDWATPARLDALSHGAIRPRFHPSTESCQALPSPKGDYFLTEWAFFPRRAWSESCGPEVRPCPSLWEPQVGAGARDWRRLAEALAGGASGGEPEAGSGRGGAWSGLGLRSQPV